MSDVALRKAASPEGHAADAHGAGPAAAGRRRKEDTRERLLAAAVERFCASGYLPSSVEDIAGGAGVTRMTFYRHFSGKAELAIELYRRVAEAAMPRLLLICARDFRDRPVVRDWIARLFAADRVDRALLHVFNEAAAAEPMFTERAQGMIAELIGGFGAAIPAFAASPDDPAQRRRWLEAWLLLHEILVQSNHAALVSGIAKDPLVIDILAERFVRFVEGGDGRTRQG